MYASHGQFPLLGLVLRDHKQSTADVFPFLHMMAQIYSSSYICPTKSPNSNRIRVFQLSYIRMNEQVMPLPEHIIRIVFHFQFLQPRNIFIKQVSGTDLMP